MSSVNLRGSLLVTSLWLGLCAFGQAQEPEPGVYLRSQALLQQFPQPSAARGGESGLIWQQRQESPADQGLLPDAILRLDDATQHVVLADLSRHQVFLIENGPKPRVLMQMYATIGKNGIGKQKQDDGKTPLGVYHIVQELTDAALPELYGSGAFPVSYPNAWDKLHQRTGYGIWLHGIPRDKYSRAPRSSEGCVAITNQDLDSLKPFIEVGNTKAVFARQLNWVSPDQLSTQAREFEQRIHAWQAAWNAIDTEQYLSFYADNFATDAQSRDEFVAHKIRVNASKSTIEVRLEDVSIFNYPDGDKLRLVEFTQYYRSDNYSSVDRKQQFWQQADDGQWFILREITVG